MTKDINQLREHIDEVDNKIVELFKQRMNIALEVGKYKAENNIPLVNGKREREILAQVAEKAGADLECYSTVLFATLFNISKSYQSQLLTDDTELARKIKNAIDNTPKMFPNKAVVACQGVEGSYGQLACDKLFSLPSIMYFNRFEGVFSAVEKGLCQYGILPIENSTAGSVTKVYDLMKKYKFYIAKSIKLRVNHCLLSKKGVKLSDIKEIYSHEQAISQCGEFLKDIPGVTITICENTAIAAKKVAESDRKDIAAISSKICAELYSLNVLSDVIQDNDNNYTRFICISKDLEIYPGADKISLMLSISHKPGELYNLIAKFATLGLNLTKLESRPVPGKDFEFMFYFDFTASVYSERVIKLLCELEKSLDQFVFIGSYLEDKN